MPGHSAVWAIVSILVVTFVSSACTNGGTAASGSGIASPTGAARGSTPGPTATAASATVTATPAGSPASAAPPDATLQVDGGDPVVGQLGSFTWGDGGSDSPWLPGSPVAVGTGERAIVTLTGGVGVASWTARRVPAGTQDGSGAVGLGSGAGPIAFAVPVPGAWSVQIEVRYAGGLGSGAYYWQLTVR